MFGALNTGKIFSMRNQIVILAAGKGTRMGNSNVPKVLTMLNNKPLILYLLDEIEKINQLAKPVIVVGHMAPKVKAVLGNDYLYAVQDKQLGTGHALMAAKYKVTGENILVLYGDHPFIKAKSLKALMQLHHKKNSSVTMFTTVVTDFKGANKPFEHFGRIVRDSHKKISKIVEYKDASVGQRKIKELNPGLYMFNAKWLWANIKNISNKNAQQEYYLTDIVEVAISQGIKVESLRIDPKEVLGVNSKEDLKLAEGLVV
jgi:UDP-N-acetylglucosamine diphosphorylase/glucosamine-1-phosphate N-acetyltransferase